DLAARVGARIAALTPLRTEVRPGELGGAAVLRGALFTARDAAQDELFSPQPLFDGSRTLVRNASNVSRPTARSGVR
ncbi:hypothetical protein ACFV0R_20410, partial [Streptomyces sp. NPDC059578]